MIPCNAPGTSGPEDFDHDYAEKVWAIMDRLMSEDPDLSESGAKRMAEREVEERRYDY
jgi:hypothetical protein